MRHPGIGSIAGAAMMVADDARRGSLGLTVPQAYEMIINRRRGWCVGKIGWTWIKFIGKTDAEVIADKDANPKWNHDGEGWHIDVKIDLGRPTVWTKSRRAYRFNWADYATEHPKTPLDAFIGHDLEDVGYDSWSAGDTYFERMARLGFFPGQEILIRGEGWSHFSQTPNGDDYNDGYDTEIVYASPVDIPDNILADLLAKDTVCHVRVG